MINLSFVSDCFVTHWASLHSTFGMCWIPTCSILKCSSFYTALSYFRSLLASKRVFSVLSPFTVKPVFAWLFCCSNSLTPMQRLVCTFSNVSITLGGRCFYLHVLSRCDVSLANFKKRGISQPFRLLCKDIAVSLTTVLLLYEDTGSLQKLHSQTQYFETE